MLLKKISGKFIVVTLSLTILSVSAGLAIPPALASTGGVAKTGAQAQTGSQAKSASIVYKNTAYGFNFTLPSSWNGYKIITSKWEGNVPSASGDLQPVTGPMLSIRHPLWTSQNPRQDIPIMIFTTDQWKAIQQDKLYIGAAPIPPSKLGSNSKYVFALPARYNYAFPAGYEEVDKILQGHPLQATEPVATAVAHKQTLLDMMKLAKQGKIINCDFPARTTALEAVEKAWGKADTTAYVASAKGRYATYSKHNVVFGINKGDQIFEVRSFDSILKKISLSEVKAVLGKPVHDTKNSTQEIIGYTAGTEFKLEFVFPKPTSSKPDPVLDHYNVLYPAGTVNSMADDPGRQW